MGFIARWREDADELERANVARKSGEYATLAAQIRRMHEGTSRATAFGTVLLAAEGVTAGGVPEAVVAVFEDRREAEILRRNAANVLGTMPCSVASVALYDLVQAGDHDHVLVQKASIALRKLQANRT